LSVEGICDMALGQVPVPGGLCGCERGEIPDEASKCIGCPDRLSSEAGETTCTRCDAGFFAQPGTENSTSRTRDQCLECLSAINGTAGERVSTAGLVVGLTCPWDSKLKDVLAEPNWWRLTSESDDLQECRESWSPIEFTPCVGGGPMSCYEGHGGPLCSVCAKSLHYQDDDGMCVECPPGAIPAIVAAAGLAGTVILMYMMNLLLHRPSKTLKMVSERFKMFLGVVQSVGPSKLKSAVTFYQIILSLPGSFDLEPIPNDLQSLMAGLKFFEFDWSEAVYPRGCIVGGYTSRMVMVAFFPIALIILIPITLIVIVLLMAFFNALMVCVGCSDDDDLEYDVQMKANTALNSARALEEGADAAANPTAPGNQEITSLRGTAPPASSNQVSSTESAPAAAGKPAPAPAGEPAPASEDVSFSFTSSNGSRRSSRLSDRRPSIERVSQAAQAAAEEAKKAAKERITKVNRRLSSQIFQQLELFVPFGNIATMGQSSGNLSPDARSTRFTGGITALRERTKSMPDLANFRQTSSVSNIQLNKWRARALQVLPLVLLVVFVMLPSVSRTIFAVWDCVPYKSGPGTTVEYLRRDLSVICGSDEHDRMAFVGILFVLLWPVGMQILFCFTLFSNRKALSRGIDNSYSRATRFLTGGYKKEYFYWEMIELFRRLTCSGFVILIPHDYISLRISLAIAISLPILVVTAVIKPWKNPEDTGLALVSQTILVFAFCVCAILKILNSRYLTEDVVRLVVGFTSPVGAFLVLGFCFMAFLLMIFGTYFYKINLEFQIQLRAKGDKVATESSNWILGGACAFGMSALVIGGILYGLIVAIVASSIFFPMGGAFGAILHSYCRAEARDRWSRSMRSIASPRDRKSSFRGGGSQGPSRRPSDLPNSSPDNSFLKQVAADTRAQADVGEPAGQQAWAPESQGGNGNGGGVSLAAAAAAAAASTDSKAQTYSTV